MKNFSVKTADFDSLSISGEAPIVQSDLGTAPNQIPLNKDLGSLAYMNAPQIEDLNVDTLELREIAAELSETAVDVFVYDTRKDSDGGAWRHRTSHTSWYNEELNTATRGGRREFPAVAVIVAETNKVTIYDGDDPDLSMWMVVLLWGFGGTPKTCCAALNGKIVVGSGWGVPQADFIKDTIDHQWNSVVRVPLGGGIINRNIDSRLSGDTSQAIVNSNANDVAMTVLPNAPIDSDTGLPIPTIAVATDGGVSVIKDDGSVVDLTTDQGSTAYAITNHISFTKDNKIRHTMDDNIRFYRTHNIPSSDDAVRHWLPELDDGITFHHTAVYGDFSYINSDYPITAIGEQSIGNGSGLTLFDENKQEPKKSIVAYVNSKYNTGWMPGDTKLATLSDTKNETVGVDESTELLVDGSGNWIGDFDVAADAEAWTISGNGTFTSTGGSATLSDPTPYSTLVEVNVANLIVGKKYILTYTTSGLREAFFEVRAGGANIATTGGFTGTRTGTFSVDFTATDTSVTIRLYDGSGIQQEDIIVSNVSVKQTGELVTNGTFDDGTTGWSSVLNATLSNDANRIKVDGTSNFATALQSITGLVSGKKYTISLELIAGTSTKPYFTTNNTGGANQISNNFDFGFQSHTFTSNGETLELRLVNSSEGSGYAFFDNVSVRLAEDDRSVNDNGLQIFGEITKSPVAPGADLVAYSGFSANNYLMQPYNSDLDFGTGDFCVMGWFNTQQTSSNAYDDLLSVGDIGVLGYGAWSEGGLLIQNRTDNNRFLSYLSAPGGQANVSLPQPYYTPNTWNHFIIKREAGLVSVFLNGVQEGAPVEYYSNVARNNNPNWKFAIGYSGDNYVYPANNSKFALFRISATAPTAEQIAKIYRDEKVLFQDGAQATLYGTSDAVTALAYDDSDDLLHVGTASGRSAFNGLKRVDNTTTAVSTAISATEGLVIEQ